jgi:hypothetical protein
VLASRKKTFIHFTSLQLCIKNVQKIRKKTSKQEIFWRNGYLAGIYKILSDESTGGMVIPPEITSSWTRRPAEEWLFCHARFISSWTRNSPEEWLFR